MGIPCVYIARQLPMHGAYRTFFACERWTLRKHRLEDTVGKDTPGNMIKLMLKDEEKWTVVATEGIVGTKESEEGLFEDVTNVAKGKQRSVLKLNMYLRAGNDTDPEVMRELSQVPSLSSEGKSV